MSDLISRKALINKLEQWQKQDGYDNEEWNLLVDVITEIKNMPPATYINVATKDGTDCISRKAAINAIDECYCGGEDSCGEPWIYKENAVEAINMVDPLPPAEPQIIRCNECKWNRTENRKETTQWLPCRALVTPDDFSCIYAERRTE